MNVIFFKTLQFEHIQKLFNKKYYAVPTLAYKTYSERKTHPKIYNLKLIHFVNLYKSSIIFKAVLYHENASKPNNNNN